MTTEQIMKELEKKGSESIRKIFKNHGGTGPMYGVKIADLKVIQKKVKKDHELAMGLFATGNYDAMYLAGLIADESEMSKKDIQQWAERSTSKGISEYTVAWVAAESEYGWELGMKWIDSAKENVASTGWNTLSGVIALKPDNELNIALIKKLLQRIVKEIHSAPNRVRYTMNGFVIGVGAYIKELTKAALEISKKIGDVYVDMGGTACKVPPAAEYIKKIEARGSIGKKKKTVKC
ncbi:MAG TPA: DNA alkylation repair protein [Chitinophagaceae bacterium]|jgi:3-methyladenine DNA glycosylase AlkD|nr:DNA alkylation repair protein [Chitinophagaceae bacterium]